LEASVLARWGLLLARNADGRMFAHAASSPINKRRPLREVGSSASVVIGGFLAGVVGKKLGLNLISKASESGRVYRIVNRLTQASDAG
jgi:hypothetical protein